MPVDDVLSAGKASLQAEALARIQQLADDMRLGLEVISVNVVSASPPDPVVAAFNDVSSAVSDRDPRDQRGRRLRQRRAAAARALVRTPPFRSPRSISASCATRRWGRADRFDRLRAEVAAAPDVSRRRLLLEAIEDALGRADLVIYASTPGRSFRLTKIR